jgi:hypothetical protein
VVLTEPLAALAGGLEGGVHGGRAAVARAVGVSALDALVLAAADAVDVGDGLDGPAVEFERAGRLVHQLLELRQREDAVQAVAELAGRGLVRVGAGGDDDRAHVELDRLELLAVDRDRDLVVAEAAALGHQLGVREHRDRRVGAHLRFEGRDQLGAVAPVGVHLGEAGDAATELCLLLDEDHLEADLGEAEGGAQAGDAAAHDEAPRRGLDDDRLESLGEARPVDAGAHQAHRLLGRALVVVGVRPRALLADVHLGVLEGVHAGALGDVAEGHRVELRRARGDDERVEALLLGVLHDLLLGRVGAGEHRRAGDDDVVVALDVLDDLVHVDVVTDVAAALADVDADLAAAHGCTFAFAASATFALSRWAAAWATAAPAWRIESGMSLAPAAAPATKTPGRLVRPGSMSSSASPT